MDASKFMKACMAGAMIVGGEKLLEGMFETWMKKITIPMASEWVTKDISLWDSMDLKWKTQLVQYSPKLGNFQFLTVEWAIKACRGSNSSLASLFLNWPEAQDWLKRNIDDLKKQIKVHTVVEVP